FFQLKHLKASHWFSQFLPSSPTATSLRSPPPLASLSPLRGAVALLACGDVLPLHLFSVIGRFSHGFIVLSIDTLHTADPFHYLLEFRLE
ncbi:unnamed protein product, partial [Thlaspi arvense]